MSATENLGAHLLGRVANTPDDRDWNLADFLPQSSGPDLHALLAELANDPLGRRPKFIAWATAITDALAGVIPAPAPNPDPPSTILWKNLDAVLDQGQTPHCVGFAWAQFGNTTPVDDHWPNEMGHTLYARAKVIDREPGMENGSSTRSGAKAMQQIGRLRNYAFARSINDIVAWITTQGPVVTGTNWHTGMFNPDSTGRVRPTGQVEGGHEWVLAGYIPNESLLIGANSWGPNWGRDGLFTITVDDYAMLFANGGDACTAVELAA